MTLKNRIKGKQNYNTGQFGEQMAERLLLSLGFKCVEKIETGWYIKWINGKVVSAKPRNRVSGDFTAIGDLGQYVHVEVKVRDRDSLLHSDLEAHQSEAMDEKTGYGALCLLIWVRSPTEIKILRWPVPGFKKNTSVKWDQIK